VVENRALWRHRRHGGEISAAQPVSWGGECVSHWIMGVWPRLDLDASSSSLFMSCLISIGRFWDGLEYFKSTSSVVDRTDMNAYRFRSGHI
jgi:hypothetical protein